MNPLPLGDMPLETFLSNYWQKKPLLIRNALADIESPVSADVLAGLACEQSVESRLIIHQGQQWDLKHGPFSDEIFTELPESHWTLLVQAVDHCVPEAAEFLEQFNFIPRWRIDDLMMSYANDGGGVGAHYDNYDVFLVQTSGQRQWEIGGLYNESSALCENLPVKILQEFKATDTWTLSPGDILYVPPGFGHNGIAQGDGCITCSVGFRAPSHSEILREYTDHIGDRLSDSLRYQDSDLNTQNNTGEISTQALDKVQQILSVYLEDKQAINDWFGRYLTTPKYQQTNDLEIQESEQACSIEQITNHLEADGMIVRNEGSRFAYTSQRKQNTLFVDGLLIKTYESTNNLIELVCKEIKFTHKDFTQTDDNLNLLLTLLKNGSLYLTK